MSIIPKSDLWMGDTEKFSVTFSLARLNSPYSTKLIQYKMGKQDLVCFLPQMVLTSTSVVAQSSMRTGWWLPLTVLSSTLRKYSHKNLLTFAEGNIILMKNLLLPSTTKLHQGNIFTGVCQTFHSGVCLSACWDTPSPKTGTPWAGNPPAGTTPGRYAPMAGTPPRHVQPRAGTLPAGTPSKRYPPRQVHPPGRYTPHPRTDTPPTMVTATDFRF